MDQLLQFFKKTFGLADLDKDEQVCCVVCHTRSPQSEMTKDVEGWVCVEPCANELLRQRAW